MAFDVDVDTKTGDIGANTKTTTEEEGSHNTTEVGSHNADLGHNTNTTELGSHNTDNHSTTTIYFGEPPAAHDAPSHESTAHHHGGHHADPAILALQQRLLENGFDPGPLDGVMGPRTEAALAAEQATYAHQRSGYGDHEAPHHHHGMHGGHGYEEQAHGGYEAHQNYQDTQDGQGYDDYPSAQMEGDPYREGEYAGEEI
jgi:hypothetical protein